MSNIIFKGFEQLTFHMIIFPRFAKYWIIFPSWVWLRVTIGYVSPRNMMVTIRSADMMVTIWWRKAIISMPFSIVWCCEYDNAGPSRVQLQKYDTTNYFYVVDVRHDMCTCVYDTTSKNIFQFFAFTT